MVTAILGKLVIHLLNRAVWREGDATVALPRRVLRVTTIFAAVSGHFDTTNDRSGHRGMI